VLAGIGTNPTLGNALAFKGGTALKKVYFDNYRFSEDLDFTLVGTVDSQRIETDIGDAVGRAQTMARAYSPIEMSVRKKIHKAPHPRGQQDFIVDVTFPWHPRSLCPVKVEITRDEPLLLPAVRHPILHGYSGEVLDASIAVYAIEEIIAEKLRTILQAHERIKQRQWVTRRGRDYFDLWRLLTDPSMDVKETLIPSLLMRKVAVRNVSYRSPDDFFPKELLDDARRHWTTSLAALVPELPPFDHVITDLRRRLEELKLVD
jgi:Uncharacterized conserved protein